MNKKIVEEVIMLVLLLRHTLLSISEAKDDKKNLMFAKTSD